MMSEPSWFGATGEHLCICDLFALLLLTITKEIGFWFCLGVWLLTTSFVHFGLGNWGPSLLSIFLLGA